MPTINTASGAMLGNPGQTNYTAAKAGIAAATLVMAQELSRYGVRAKLSRARSANAAHAADTRPRGSRSDTFRGFGKRPPTV